MEEKRIPVYGEDAEGKRKRAFDWLKQEDGQTFAETINRNGHKVKTPVDAALAALEQLKQEAG